MALDLDELDSFMYQTVGHEALALLAECMNLPLFTETICGKSVARDRDYIPTAADEVEDLVRLLESVKVGWGGRHPLSLGWAACSHVIFGQCRP